MRQILASDYNELLRVIRHARQRWRMKVFLRGSTIVLAAGFVAFAVSVWGMDYFLYREGAVLLFRILTYVALAALVVRFLVLPLSRRVTDEQVALYIEEHEPSLQESVLSAVDLGSRAVDQKTNLEEMSPLLTRRVLQEAIVKCQEIDYAQRIERGNLRRFSSGLATVAGAAAVAVLLSPAFLQHGALLLFTPWKSEALDNPYQISVSPGSLAVPRGADQQILATLLGFDAGRVDLVTRTGEGEWERWEMTRGEYEGEGPVHDFMLLNLQDRIEYFVEANSVRSPIHRIDVTDLPYVERLDFEYRFPAYTGLEPRIVEGGGDVAALLGTQVAFTVEPTFPVPGGRILLESGVEIPLERGAEGSLTGLLEISANGFYHVELLDAEGTLHEASPEYAIEVLQDQPPILHLEKPGRDTRANMIDEIFVEVEAEDDFGVDRLELLYSVNGDEEQREILYGRGRGAAPRKEVRSGYTFFLEELDLQVGDFVSYYARARDGNSASGRQQTTSDIYFIEIRPFGQDYRRAEQGGAAGAGGGGLDNTLSLRQRQIIAATFRLVRDREEYSNKEYSENLATLALLQGRLREQVDTLVMRMQNRATLLDNDSFREIIGLLENASGEMQPAQEELAAEKPQQALPPEQRALKFLQRSESVFRDVRVSFDPSGGGGGGSEAERLAEDLADLFELELDKLRNQYETVQRGERQAMENQIDEALQKLQELARRQQQENERARRRASQSQVGGGGGRQQQELMEETEELARRLERLAREQSRPELQETAQRLRQAMDSMKRSGANRSSQSLAEGVAALDQLRQARRLLDKSRSLQLEDEMEEMQQRAERISQLQERIQSQVDQLGESGRQESAPGQGRSASGESGERLERLMERKDQLAQEVAALEEQLDRAARKARSEEKEAARELQGAANSIRENQLKEKIRYSKGVVRGREPSYARLFEEEIEADIDDVRQRIGSARGAIGETEQESREEALERTRELVQSMESLEARLRDQQASAAGEQGNEGERRGEQNGGEQAGGEQAGGEPGDSRRGERLAEQRSSSAGEQQGQSGEQQGQSQSGEQPGGERGGEQQQAQGSQEGEGGQRGGTTQIGPSGRSVGFQPGIFSRQDLRQIQRELEQRLTQGQELRDELRSLGLGTADLDDILRQMRDLSARRINNDPLALDQLRGDVVEGLRQFEYRLWRDLEIEQEKLRLTGADEVPAAYRELVELYFQRLSEGGE